MKIPKLDPIDGLMRIKFPDGWLIERRVRLDPDATQKAVIEEMAAYRAMLEVLPELELKELYRKESINFNLQKLENEEKMRPFNQPDATADFGYWCRATYWSIDEAVALLLGKNPEIVTWALINESPETSPFANEFKRVKELARRAVKWKQLLDPVLPTIFVRWAKNTQLDMPKELVDNLDKYGANIVDWKQQFIQLEKNFNLLVEQYSDLEKEKERLSTTVDASQALNRSEYWNELLNKINRAIEEYPNWQQGQKKVQKTGNLQNWLVESIGADSREAEIFKKILSDIFHNSN